MVARAACKNRPSATEFLGFAKLSTYLVGNYNNEYAGFELSFPLKCTIFDEFCMLEFVQCILFVVCNYFH